MPIPTVVRNRNFYSNIAPEIRKKNYISDLFRRPYALLKILKKKIYRHLFLLKDRWIPPDMALKSILKGEKKRGEFTLIHQALP